ncbi:MAG: hypothetical protein ACE147_00720 [Candidatus Methylomirabilales bacterium]
MTRVGLLLLVALVSLVACATPQVTMPAGAAAVLYANARADYAVAKVLAGQACKSGKLEGEACEALAQVDVKAKIYRDAIERALLDPTQPVDWAQVVQYSGSVVELLVKIGVLPAAP